MSWTAILSLLPQLLTGKIFGIPIATIIAWFKSAQGQAAIAVIKGVIDNLKANGDQEFVAATKALAMIAKVHKMTKEEEEIWMNRASNVGASG